MQTLTIAPPVPYVIPADAPLHVMLVGCGGTGSHLAQALARLAYHVRESGLPPLGLTFLDGDIVEPHNIGRQLFGVADIGTNKAQALAARFNMLFGLRILAVPEMATPTLLSNLEPVRALGVLIGAVDSVDGRHAMASALGGNNYVRGDFWRLWLDCGNETHAGQVAIGTTNFLADLTGSFALGGVCSALPSPAVLYPDLLTPPAEPQPQMDCATAMIDGAQSLMVNQQMAAIAAQYCYQLAVHRRLTTFATTVDLASLTMRSRLITPGAIVEALDGQTTEQALTTLPETTRSTA